MKTAVTPVMRAYLAGAQTKLSSCWLVVRVDGEIFAFTDHDQNISFDLEAALTNAGITPGPGIAGTGTQTYLAASGYTPTDVSTSSALNVDNMELHGVLVSPSITEADLNAGLWDFAAICTFMVKWETTDPVAITSITRSGGLAHVTVASTRNLATGFGLTVFGAAQTEYNGLHTITVVNATTFTYPVTGTPTTPATGLMAYVLEYGAIVERVGHIGEVTVERGVFKAEMRGLMQAYTRTYGRLAAPSCNADLGDARCTVDLTAFTVTSTITGVNPDGVTLYDSARTEPGPTGAVNILNVSNANPGVVRLTGPFTFPLGSPVTISQINGMPLLNQDTIIRNPDYAHNHFDLGIDTSDTSIYGTYLNNGIVTPLGGTTGYFDYGLITFTSGLNTGLSMEVKSYVPGQITLQLPFPYAVAVGDAYTMHAGCDKSLATCRDRFSNLVNMRAFPYLPGIDKLVQVGRHNG